MKFLLLLLSMAYADEPTYKFHYGDKVIVHSTAWRKPCFSDDFYNVCGKTGTVVGVETNTGCSPGKLYKVRFEFKDLSSIENIYCDVHLASVKK